MSNYRLLNEGAAYESALKIADDVRRNFVLFGIAAARQRATRQVGQTYDDWTSAQPAEPFDMSFFCSILEALIANRAVLDGILDGRSLAEAGGWDV